MSNLTERIDAYTGTATDAPQNVADVILGVLRQLSEQVIELSTSLKIVAAIDDLRGERIKQLQAQLDRLEERIDF